MLKLCFSPHSTGIMKYYTNEYIHLPWFVCVFFMLGNWILSAKHTIVLLVASVDCVQ